MKNRLLRCAMLLFPFALALGQTQATPPTASRPAAVHEEEFGRHPDGSVKRFTLRNSKGATVRLISLGATITELSMPARDGAFASVVRGADTFAPYGRGFPMAAAVQGRVANRIANAKFTLDGKDYTLTPNAGPHLLHGGRKGFAQSLWNGRTVDSPDGQSVQFTYLSKDGEEGFPGNLTAKVTYTLTDNNELRLAYEATTDAPTLVNLTNHAYFNLGGPASTNCHDHDLQIHADQYTVAQALIPTGEIAPVKGTPLDFTSPKKIGADIAKLAPPARTYDDNFVLNSGGKALALAARAFDPATGRVMEVHTDAPGLQLYVNRTNSFCLEPHAFPDAIHHPDFPSIVLRPSQTYKTTTVFAFSVK